MSGIVLTNVTKSFGGLQVVRGIDLTVGAGEFCVLVGPSGCGKSTLLRMIAGLESMTEGDIRIGDRSVTHVEASERGVAMVFQNYALYPHMTVAQNMGFALKMARMPQETIAGRVRDAARILQIEQLLDRKPAALSGGQRQRVAIGRAIVRDPDVFLFDEPLSNLDAALRVQTRIELARLHSRLGATMIYVTHDQTEAMTLADRIVVMNAGRAEQTGAPLDLYLEPANLFVAGFIGSPAMNLIPVHVSGVDSSGVSVVLPGGTSVTVPRAPRRDASALAGKGMTLGIRPEHLALSPEAPLLICEGPVLEQLGSDTFCHGSISGGTRLVARLPGGRSEDKGAPLRLSFDVADAHLFDGAGEALPRLPSTAGT